jgi:arylsulfatase A-like enzyme
MHMPVIPRTAFTGETGQGEWADSLLELDTDFGTLLDLLDELGVTDDTLVVFAGDNGPEVQTWRGTPGFWEGSSFAGGEGNLRTACIVRWPGHVTAGAVSDDILHITDWFPTILRAAGVAAPDDRVIDGVDQLDWLCGRQPSSQRDGYIYWMGPAIYGVKWQNFKLALVAQKYSTDPVGKLSSPRLINLITDPQEREPINPSTSTPGPSPTSTASSASSERAWTASRSPPRAPPSTTAQPDRGDDTGAGSLPAALR